MLRLPTRHTRSICLLTVDHPICVSIYSPWSLMSVVTLCNAGFRVVFKEWGIGVTVTYRGVIFTEGKACATADLWMDPINNEPNSQKKKRVNVVSNVVPNITSIRMNQQVNDTIANSFGV